MNVARSDAVLRPFHTLMAEGSIAGLSDTRLLERFVARSGEGAEIAFAALVARHGPMVLQVCRTLLADDHEAEDAFQATFLVLARRAGTIREPELLAHWLHGVALRTARVARSRAMRHRDRQTTAAGSEDALPDRAERPESIIIAREEAAALHEEVDRLPDRYRKPVVLCYFEGLTHADAARRLRRSEGVVSVQLKRAREKLRARLTRRGLISSALLPDAGALVMPQAPAPVPTTLLDATVEAGLRSTAGGVLTAGAASASVAALTRGVLRTLLLSRLKLTAGILLSAGTVVAGAAVLAQQPRGPGQAAAEAPSGRKAAAYTGIPRVDDVRANQNKYGDMYKARVAQAPPLKYVAPPVPKDIPVNIAGRALDTAGQPVKGATVYLMDTWLTPKVVSKTTTDDDGRYVFRDARVPATDGSLNGVKSPNTSPFAWFQVIATAPGYGLSWHQPESMYAHQFPDPLDIQGRHPFGEPIVMDLTFRPADSLRGTVVDENGTPLKGIELSIVNADLLDAAGLETSRILTNLQGIAPDGSSQTVTGANGRFRIGGLPSEACFMVGVKRADFPAFGEDFYAATILKPVAEHGEPSRHSGRGPHSVRSGDITLVQPTPRRFPVRVVDDQTGKPIANIGAEVPLWTPRWTGLHSWGQSDAQGMLTLELPPGRYNGIVGNQPKTSRYIRTYQEPLIVPSSPAQQPYELRMKLGFELEIDAIDRATGKGIPEALFWLVPVDPSGNPKRIEPSTLGGVRPWTDERGHLRAVLPPEPGKTYRITFAGIQPPNRSPYHFGPEFEQPKFDVQPPQSDPFTLEAGKSLSLRFTLNSQPK